MLWIMNVKSKYVSVAKPVLTTLSVGLFSLLLLMAEASVAAEPSRYEVHAQAVIDQPGANYYTSLLEMILNASRKPGETIDYIYTDRQYSQARWLAELQQSPLNQVMWTVTNRERETLLRPIRVPISKGLLGVRLLIIRKEDQATFAAIKSPDQLKSLMAGQGINWPDAKILMSNGFSVTQAKDKNVLFRMLVAKRFDYFPRGVVELEQDKAFMEEHNLMVDPHWLLVYSNPMYFFVNKNNEELAQRLEKGWQIIYQNGQHDKYFFAQPRIQTGLAELKKHRRKIIYLANPDLPSETPLDNKTYWLDVNNLQKP